jgi:hypothetical protein
MAAYWGEARAMAFASDKEISTVLLVFPEIKLFGEDYRCGVVQRSVELCSVM